jgi:AcrR family transcriptional regulator
MGRRGWNGSPPSDDDDARKRILDAAVRCVEEHGAEQINLASVATALGVTRRTVYRYFASTDDLFAEVGSHAFDTWLERLERATAHLDSPVDLLIESVAYIIEELPDQPLLILLMTSGRSGEFSRRMLEPETIARCRSILFHSRIDWVAAGFDDTALDELIEYLLRVIQSMVVAPSPQRDGAALRTYLRRWIGPAIAGGSATPP